MRAIYAVAAAAALVGATTASAGLLTNESFESTAVGTTYGGDYDTKVPGWTFMTGPDSYGEFMRPLG